MRFIMCEFADAGLAGQFRWGVCAGLLMLLLLVIEVLVCIKKPPPIGGGFGV
jgi:hypothetical protein